MILFVLLLVCATLFPGCHSQQQGLPAVVKKAIKVLEQEGDDSNDSASLYKVAKAWLSDTDSSKGKRVEDGWELVQYLANEQSHVPSMAKMGNRLAAEGNTPAALNYFQMAGENGPHHASLYNAGNILAQTNDWVGALAYLKAGATLHATHPSFASEATTRVSTEAFEIVSERIAKSELSLRESADIFLYASLHDLPTEAEDMWKGAVMSMIRFNDTFVETDGGVQDPVAMSGAVKSLRTLWESYSPVLSNLQGYLVLDHMNDMLGPLSGLDEKYVPMAAGYAEALATSQYCIEQFAVTERDPACFNGAAASAVSYYRRIQDDESANRVVEFSRSHPKAATHWDSALQTPRVYHPELSSKPWWNPTEFSAAAVLMDMYRNKKTRTKLLNELEAVKALQEGKLRSGNNMAGAEVEVDANGNVATSKSSSGRGSGGSADGVQRIFTPYIGVRTEMEQTRQDGAGGWGEFGPLFDGNQWNERNCRVVPTICKALRDDPSLCTARQKAGIQQQQDVWELCGSDTVVTILRLRPGTTILPHCGTTNSRLIMHFPLVGADGVQFTVGEKLVESYGGGDGHAIVFDDSFEHYVHHGGTEDRFIVLAVLSHPELK